MFQIISGTSKTVSGTQNLERNVPNTAHTNVPTNSVLLGTLFLLAFPVEVTGVLPAELLFGNMIQLVDRGISCHNLQILSMLK